MCNVSNDIPDYFSDTAWNINDYNDTSTCQHNNNDGNCYSNDSNDDDASD